MTTPKPPAPQTFWATQHPLEKHGTYVMVQDRKDLSHLDTAKDAFMVVEMHAFDQAIDELWDIKNKYAKLLLQIQAVASKP